MRGWRGIRVVGGYLDIRWHPAWLDWGLLEKGSWVWEWLEGLVWSLEMLLGVPLSSPPPHS